MQLVEVRLREGLTVSAELAAEYRRWVAWNAHGNNKNAPLVPEMPPGVRVVRLATREPPVSLVPKVWVVVTDSELFARSTLGRLEQALAGNHWGAGNRTIDELIDCLKQVGVEVELIGKRTS
jgi:hypothetical protein